MPHHNDTSRRDRIEELKRRVNEATGGQMIAGTSAACPAEIEEKFWERVLAYETAENVPLFDQLLRAGVALPRPEELSDADVSAKLWEVIRALAALNTFLHSTNHLSDRELYAHLWHDALRVPEPVLPAEMGYQTHIDLVGDGSEEDVQTYLRYYADEPSRRSWSKEFPGKVVPAHEEPPYDRDDHLPGADW